MRRAGTSGIGAQEWGHECDKESGPRKGRSSTRFNQMPPALAILATELFASKRIGAFRFSAALIEWSKSELDRLQKRLFTGAQECMACCMVNGKLPLHFPNRRSRPRVLASTWSTRTSPTAACGPVHATRRRVQKRSC